METVELKANLHQLIDDLEDPQVLELLKDYLSNKKDSQVGKLWSELTYQQQAEVLAAAEESEEYKNLTPHSEILKKLK